MRVAKMGISSYLETMSEILIAEEHVVPKSL